MRKVERSAVEKLGDDSVLTWTYPLVQATAPTANTATTNRVFILASSMKGDPTESARADPFRWLNDSSRRQDRESFCAELDECCH